MRFKLASLLTCFLLVALFLTSGKLIGIENTLLLLFLFCTFFALTEKARSRFKSILLLIIGHAFLAFFLFVVIICYHANGRAFYDYGISGWNPPVSVDEDGKTWVDDYDPKYTPPGSWPVVGSFLLALCNLSLGVVLLPPLAPSVAVSSFLGIRRWQHLLPVNLASFLWTVWGIGVLPVVYMLLWGWRLWSWAFD